MIRKIKFRGRSIGSNEWIYGDLVRSSDMKRYAILVNNKSSYDECEVNPFSVGQFTGLYDMDGREIYEGDILWWNRDGMKYLVKFVDGMFYASIIDPEKRIFGGYPLHVLTEHKEEWECEIVGNAFDNKELLSK